MRWALCLLKAPQRPAAALEAEAAMACAAPVHAGLAHCGWSCAPGGLPQRAPPRTQEIPQPELQPLALEAKAAAALLKYVPLPARLLPGAIGHLAAGAGAELWAARAAALVFAQYLWFRHTFLLAARQAAALRGLAEAALADRKLEVGELAAGTLSGMLKARGGPDTLSLGAQYPALARVSEDQVPSVLAVIGALPRVSKLGLARDPKPTLLRRSSKAPPAPRRACQRLRRWRCASALSRARTRSSRPAAAAGAAARAAPPVRARPALSPPPKVVSSGRGFMQIKVCMSLCVGSSSPRSAQWLVAGWRRSEFSCQRRATFGPGGRPRRACLRPIPALKS